jgi:enoyl-CoA hydratase
MEYSDFKHLLFEKKENKIILLTINRPEKMNAANARMHWELTQVWKVMDDDDDVNVIVVTGAGDRAFCSGGDLEWVEEMVGNAKILENVQKEAGDLVFEMLKCRKPIISAINGTAVGAGLVVALMADISIMSEQAKLTDGHVKIGVGAGDHAAIIWPILCGMAKAKYYLMTADLLDGKEAERIGLISKCVPHDEVMTESWRVAEKLALGSQPAIRGTKMTLNGWMQLAAPIFENSLRMEMLCFMGDDAREGAKAFLEKRTPSFPSAG